MTGDDLAWLAGLIDGEGSVSVTNGAYVQMSMTHLPTILRAADIIGSIIGQPCPVYAYDERDPRHKRAAHVRVSGPQRCLRLARVMHPRSTTKRRQWALMIQYCESRIIAHATRGQRARKSDLERIMALASRIINRRGAA